MNRTEQKERLTDIMVTIKDLKEELSNKIKDIGIAFGKIDDLTDTLYNISQVDSWDEEQLKQDILRAVFQDSLMQNICDELYDFKNDIEVYMDEISESKQEKLEERYANLEEACEKFDINQEYDSIENAIEHIEEAEEMIKEMKK